jgi:HEAT repeat protein
MDQETSDYLSSMEADLRQKRDRSAELDELFQLTFLGDTETRQKATWCIAKMGQNKVPDTRIVDILAPLASDDDTQVRENVAWGLGEVAGAGIGGDVSVIAVRTLLTDADRDVRGMAAWAAGRLRHKLAIFDESTERILRLMSSDESEYVKKAALFALEGQEQK